jgi:spermidine synthase
MPRLAMSFPPLVALNKNSFRDHRVTLVNDDADVWLQEHAGWWDVIIVDFPDPNTFALGKLYTRAFYKRVLAHLAPGGAGSIHATSPLFARKSYWCIVDTVQAAGFSVKPYAVAVPSFGVWGYVLAKRTDFNIPQHAPSALALRFLNDDALRSMFDMPADMQHVPVEINQLDNQALVRYYEKEWRRWE